MKFYNTGYSETHIAFIDDADDMVFQNIFIKYRLSGRFPDYAVIKKELKNFIEIYDPMGFDSVEIKQAYEIPRFGLDPGGYGKVYDILFGGHDIKYIIIIRRLSFYWFNLEIFEDRFSKLFRRITSVPTEDDDETLQDILKKYKPIKSLRFQKFK